MGVGDPCLNLHLIIVICGDTKAVKNGTCTMDMSANVPGGRGGGNESEYFIYIRTKGQRSGKFISKYLYSDSSAL